MHRVRRFRPYTLALATSASLVTACPLPGARAATTLTINPSDDGSIYGPSFATADHGAYLMASGNTRAVAEFPLPQPAPSFQSASLSVNPYGLPVWGPILSVYAYPSTDGTLTPADYDAGTYLGQWILPPIGYGQDAFFDVSAFLRTVSTPYVGFNLRSTDTDVFSSLEYNYGHPAQLSILVPEPGPLATALLSVLPVLITRLRRRSRA